MKNSTILYILGFFLLVSVTGCDGDAEDTPPPAFTDLVANDDEIYLYNGDSPEGTRLDPLLNDSIKVEASVDYDGPFHGAIAFFPNEGWFYKPDEGFIGTETVDYRLCHKNRCVSATITIHVEPPLNAETCVYSITGESVRTKKNTPVEIRIFNNDVVCPYMGFMMSSPEKGTFRTYFYSGSYKNNVYVYYPPKDFVGTDRFVYKIFTDDGDKQAYCDIVITE